jgi:protein Tex
MNNISAGVNPIIEKIALASNIPLKQVQSVLDLSSQGGTVAFIARYRKENTGGLDEVAIRDIINERDRVMDILDRQQTIIRSIEEQKKLSPELKVRILSTFNKLELEDIYAPYKKKKKTKADIARELGIEPFADSILKQRVEEGDYLKFARNYLDASKGLTDPELIVEHAVNIVTEIIAHDVELKKRLRAISFENGFIYSKKAVRFKEQKSKFDNYFDYKERIKNLTNPKSSHRVLAIQRGFNEKVLSIGVDVKAEPCLQIITDSYVKNQKSIFYPLLLKAIEFAYKDYLAPSIEADIFNELKNYADRAAISVFSKNVKDLLLQSPLGSKVTIGIDPGFKTGAKIALVGTSGNLLHHTTIYAVEPHNKVEESGKILLNLCSEYNVEAIAIGNGTASRETEKFVLDFISTNGLAEKIIVVVVNESGASIYSASDLAREELPGLDITFRGAVSIARRLQDPLAELVKIDPKSIGVGQYQHDVDQKYLQESLESVVEDCVNYVGVDLNTASPHLLAYVSGIGKVLSKSIIEYRLSNGLFKNRSELLNVPKLGDKAFEQCAGFLRIRDGENPLDNTGVHPEKYSFIEDICSKAGLEKSSILGNSEKISSLFSSEDAKQMLGEYTVKYIIDELNKPGRDPRTAFKKVEFHEGIKSLEDLKVGMMVNGVVTNITNFGVFVNIGVHDDGLIHISELTDNGFVNDPRQVLSLGQELNVRVLSVDIDKKQISLSMKKERPVKPQYNKSDRENLDRTSYDKKGVSNNRTSSRGGAKGSNKSYDKGSYKPKERVQARPRPPRVDPNSPFAVLAQLREKVTKK